MKKLLIATLTTIILFSSFSFAFCTDDGDYWIDNEGNGTTMGVRYNGVQQYYQQQEAEKAAAVKEEAQELYDEAKEDANQRRMLEISMWGVDLLNGGGGPGLNFDVID